MMHARGWFRTVRSLAPLAVAVVVVAAACGGGGDKASTPTSPGTTATTTVSMPGNSFAPVQVVVTVGSTVAWDFPSVAHNVIFDKTTGAPADINITSNTIVTRTFGTKGTFNYSCTLHSGMIGTVVAN